MILPYQQIIGWAESGGLDPFTLANVQAASVDLCIGPQIVNLAYDTKQTVDRIEIYPGEAILATTVERICLPDNIAATVYLKSSWARRGLDHALAGWVDPGFRGQLTLELHAHKPLVIEPGDTVVQLVLQQLTAATEKPYNGRYQNQNGPTEAR